MRHFTISELEAGIDRVLDAPADSGSLSLIVRRPSEGVREVLAVGQLDLAEGLLGDRWKLRTETAEGGPDPYNQINVMSARAVSLIAGEPSDGNWPATSSTWTSISVLTISPPGPALRSVRR